MNERYVSFNNAKLLKEKGFDWKCITVYIITIEKEKPIQYILDTLSDYNNGKVKYCISCPTQQMACDWLEKTHGLFIKIGRSMDINSNYYYSYNVLDKDNISQIKNIRPSKEEAIESALEYALTNLI